MIRLIQRRLIIPRGDTGTFTVPVLITNNLGDVAVFSILDERTNSKVFEKVVQVSDKTITIDFSHNDTVNLPIGKFVWDIKFYQNPEFVDDKLVNGTEIHSYYAAFTLPTCEIRQTADNLLMSSDAPTTTLTSIQLNYMNAAINEINEAKREAINAAQSVKNYVDSITPSETMTAETDIQDGKYFMNGNVLYQATTNILTGEEIVLGTNCEVKNIAEALNALL